MDWTCSSSSWGTISFQSHQTLSITFLGVNTGFATVCEAFPDLDHDLFRTLLSYLIHFSPPVIICLKNSSISFRFSSDSQMKTRSIKFFTVNSCGTQVSSFFWYPVLCQCFKTVLWSMFGTATMLRDEICRSTSIFFKNFINFFNDWPARARFIFNIEISGTKSRKPTLTLAFT